jgi:hypothetical protein
LAARRLDPAYLSARSLAELPEPSGNLLVASRGDPFEAFPVREALVALYAVRTTGLALVGPEPDEIMGLIDQLHWRAALAEYLRHCRHWVPAERPGERAFRVLSAARVLVALASGRSLSKTAAAAEIALGQPELAPLLAAALACRASGYRVGFDDAASAVGAGAFIAAAIARIERDQSAT